MPGKAVHLELRTWDVELHYMVTRRSQPFRFAAGRPGLQGLARAQSGRSAATPRRSFSGSIRSARGELHRAGRLRPGTCAGVYIGLLLVDENDDDDRVDAENVARHVRPYGARECQLGRAGFEGGYIACLVYNRR